MICKNSKSEKAKPHLCEATLSNQKEDRENIIKVAEELDTYKSKVKVLSDALVKLEKRVDNQEHKQLLKDKDSMKNNLFFSGFKETEEKSCTQIITNFLSDIMKIKETIPIAKAIWYGSPLPKKHRQILVTLQNSADKGKIFGNIKLLKGVQAEAGKYYQIREHLPEAMVEE